MSEYFDRSNPQPKEFVYAVGYDEMMGDTFVSITPVKFWIENQCAYDEEHLGLPEDILPRHYADEVMEATYVYPGNLVEEIDQEFKDLGYIDDPKYKEFMTPSE